jgi:hypothetical protein
MRNIITGIAALIMCIIIPANSLLAEEPADQEVTLIEDGAVGFFRYAEDDFYGKHFTVFSNPELTGGSGFFGRITDETKVNVANREVRSELLDLLHKKRVLIYAKFRQVGRSEGSIRYCTEMTIYILPEKKR